MNERRVSSGVWSRTPECDPEKNPTELKKIPKSKTFWIAFWRSTPLADNAPWLAFPVGLFFVASVRVRTLARNFIIELGIFAGYRETAL